MRILWKLSFRALFMLYIYIVYSMDISWCTPFAKDQCSLKRKGPSCSRGKKRGSLRRYTPKYIYVYRKCNLKLNSSFTSLCFELYIFIHSPLLNLFFLILLLLISCFLTIKKGEIQRLKAETQNVNFTLKICRFKKFLC